MPQTMSAGYYQNPEIMKEYLLSDDMRNMTEFQIVENKSLDKLIEKAKIVEKVVTDDEDENEAKEDAGNEEEKSDA